MYPIVSLECNECHELYTFNGNCFKASCECSTSLNTPAYLEPNPPPVCATCPVCDGTGFVHYDFYGKHHYYTPYYGGSNGVLTWTTDDGAKTTCRSCNGKGIVWKE